MCDKRNVVGSFNRLVEFQSDQYIAHIKRLRAIRDLALAEKHLSKASLELDAAQKKLDKSTQDFERKSRKTSLAFEANYESTCRAANLQSIRIGTRIQNNVKVKVETRNMPVINLVSDDDEEEDSPSDDNQARPIKATNSSRSYEVGNKVMVLYEALVGGSCSSACSSGSTQGRRYIGPVEILHVYENGSYRIELPHPLRNSNDVVPGNVCKLYRQVLSGDGPLDITVDANGTVEQEVSEILEKKVDRNRRVWYKVLFAYDPPHEAQWHPVQDLRNCMELIRKFERKAKRRKR